jgi:hypothetical protein
LALHCLIDYEGVEEGGVIGGIQPDGRYVVARIMAEGADSRLRLRVLESLHGRLIVALMNV